MKLKEGFILHTTGGEHMMVATGKLAKKFSGLVRNNDTAQIILEQLQKDTTEQAIVDAMMEQYDAPRQVVEKDVHTVLEQLRGEGFLDE